MPMWSKLLMQESNSLVMQLLSLFHDYALAVMMMILIFVTGVSIFMVTDKMISDSPFMVMVEVIWTVIPMVILAFMAIPSLKILCFSGKFDSYMIPNSMLCSSSKQDQSIKSRKSSVNTNIDNKPNTEYSHSPKTVYTGDKNNYQIINEGNTVNNGNWKIMLFSNITCLLVGLVAGSFLTLAIVKKFS